MKRQKEDKKPAFNIIERGFRAKAWYLKDIKESKGDALIQILYKRKIIKQFLFPSYKIFNIPAHFNDIVDSELSKTDKERGYRMAVWNGIT